MANGSRVKDVNGGMLLYYKLENAWGCRRLEFKDGTYMTGGIEAPGVIAIMIGIPKY